MSGKAARIVLTENQKMELENIKRSRIAQQRLIERAQLILLAADGMLNCEISPLVGMSLDPKIYAVMEPELLRTNGLKIFLLG